MERVVLLHQWNLFGLTEPLHQQRHRGDRVAVVQQGLDHQGVRLGHAELLDVLTPEGQITGLGPAFVPCSQRGGHIPGRIERGLAGHPFDGIELAGGILVPPTRHRGEVFRERLFQGRFAGGGSRLVDPHVEREDVADHAQQLIDAMVVNAVLDGRKEAVLAVEAQNVPGIDHGPALDRAAQQGFDPRQLRGRFGQLAAIDGPVGGDQIASHFAGHAG